MNNHIEVAKEILQKRHSQYALAPQWMATEAEVEQLLGDVLQQVPSHFNSQPVRIVLLKGKAHKAHWKLIEEILIDKIGEDKYNQSTRAKIESSFLSGVGTVLFFDDSSVTKQLQEKFPAYAQNFPIWAQQVQGSHQLAVWLGLSALGFGASLQHYNGINDDKIREQLGVPHDWHFVAHMPFGQIVKPSQGKDKLPLSDTLIIRE